MITPSQLLGMTCDAAMVGSLKGLPADVTVRKMVTDLKHYAETLEAPSIGTAYGMLFVADQIHWRAVRLVAIATLPQAPSIDEQEEMRGDESRDAAERSVLLALQAGLAVDADMVAAVFDASPAWAGEVFARARLSHHLTKGE